MHPGVENGSFNFAHACIHPTLNGVGVRHTGLTEALHPRLETTNQSYIQPPNARPAVIPANMANIRPKLSRAMRRELEIREQLGIGKNAWRVKGRKGAERARKELERRQKQKRRRGPGWDGLCYELQDMVLKRLSIADLQAVREAGLGGVSIASCERLRNIMLHRCASVKPLWKNWQRGTPGYATKHDRDRCTPVEFTSKVAKLCVTPDEGVIPDSISEMKSLQSLDVSRVHNSPFSGVPPPLTTLPMSLGLCTGLLELRLSHQAFEEVPGCVLMLKNLRRLELEFNSKLKCLPQDVGDKLENLRYISIRGCRQIKSLPASLLLRLEMKICGRQRHRIPLQVTGRYFEGNYLQNTITESKYPNLAEYLKNGSLTGQDIVMWGEPDFDLGPDFF